MCALSSESNKAAPPFGEELYPPIRKHCEAELSLTRWAFSASSELQPAIFTHNAVGSSLCVSVCTCVLASLLSLPRLSEDTSEPAYLKHNKRQSIDFNTRKYLIWV